MSGLDVILTTHNLQKCFMEFLSTEIVLERWFLSKKLQILLKNIQFTKHTEFFISHSLVFILVKTETLPWLRSKISFPKVLFLYCWLLSYPKREGTTSMASKKMAMLQQPVFKWNDQYNTKTGDTHMVSTVSTPVHVMFHNCNF